MGQLKKQLFVFPRIPDTLGTMFVSATKRKDPGEPQLADALGSLGSLPLLHFHCRWYSAESRLYVHLVDLWSWHLQKFWTLSSRYRPRKAAWLYCYVLPVQSSEGGIRHIYNREQSLGQGLYCLIYKKTKTYMIDQKTNVSAYYVFA